MRYIIILLCFALWGKAYAQFHHSPSYRQYTTSDGLPSSQVQGVFEDSHGYIWTITNRGAARFDGYSFRVYTTKNGLPTNNVLLINEDHKGRMWFMCNDGSYCYLNNDTILSYEGNEQIQQLLKDRLPGPFFFDEKDTLWATTFSGIQLFKCFGKKVEEYKPPITDGDPTYYLRRIGEKLLALHVGDVKENDQIRTRDNINYLLSLSGDCKLACSIHLNDKKWAVAGPGGLVLFDESGKVQTQFSESPYVFSSLERDRSGNIWMTNSNGAQLMLDLESNSEASVNYFEGHYIMTVLQDRQGNYWFGDRDNGLFFVPSLDIEVWKGYGVTKQNNLVSVKVKNDQVFVADASGMVYQMQGKELLPILSNGPQSAVTADFIITDTGKIITGNKAFIFSSKNAEGKMLCNPESTARRMIQLKDGRILFTLSTGIAFWEEKKGWIEVPADVFKQRVICALEEKDGSIWLGTEKGLWKWDGVKAYPIKLPEELSDTKITEMVSFDGGLVLATRGDGLIFFRKNKIEILKERDGLDSEMIDALCVDGDGGLWIGSAKGLQRLSIKNGQRKFEQLNYGKGLPSNEVNDVIFFQGKLLVATHDGLAIVDPKASSLKAKSFPVQIIGVYNEGKSIPITTEVILDPFQDDVKIDFASLNYRTGKQGKYRYRLIGLHDQWVETEAHEIDYWSLTPGNYSFEVCAMDEDGNWGESSVLPIQLTAHFTQTIWFKVLIVVILLLLFVAIVFAIYRSRKRKIVLQLKMNELRQQALAANMNPHFIFNSLNSIQHYINSNKAIEANEYLVSFARLVRMNLESWQTGMVSLKDELERLQLYLQLEKMRQPELFDFRIIADSEINQYDFTIPPMLLQPYAENAVIHGLSPMSKGGNLDIRVNSVSQEYYEVIIEDNGIGLEASKKNKRTGHQSLALGMNAERLSLFQQATNCRFEIKIQERSGGQSGTQVTITLPKEV